MIRTIALDCACVLAFAAMLAVAAAPPTAPPSPQDLQAQADAYARLFTIFAKHKDAIERVTFWGLSDRRSWRAGQHPLVFDADNQRKPAYTAIVDALSHPKPGSGAPR